MPAPYYSDKLTPGLARRLMDAGHGLMIQKLGSGARSTFRVLAPDWGEPSETEQIEIESILAAHRVQPF